MKTIKKHFPAVIFITGLIAALFSLMPVLSYQGATFRGYEIILGGEIFNLNPFNLGSVASAYLPFSWSALAAFFLPLLAGAIMLYTKRLIVVSTSLFIISVVLFIMMPEAIEIIYVIAGTESSSAVEWNLEAGYVGGLTTSVIGSLLNIVLIMKKV